MTETEIKKVSKGISLSIRSNYDLKEQAKRGVNLKLNERSYTLLEKVNVGHDRDKKPVYEVLSVDEKGHFHVLGGYPNEDIQVLKRNLDRRFFKNKIERLSKLRTFERFERFEEVSINIIEPKKHSTTSSIGKTDEGVVAFFKKGSDLEPGQTWLCRVLSVKEKYIMAKPLKMLRTAEENEISFRDRAKSLVSKFNSL